jgi:hypothetical protein
MINQYFYEAGLRRYLSQFAAIFSGLQVQTGYGECGEAQFITVPTVMGDKDRVVAALHAGNTQNRMFSLPTMSFHMTGLTVAPERRKSSAFVDQRVHLPQGGVYPQDLTVVKRVMPVPYNMQLELSIWASNRQQLHQILEQILVLFNPDLQIQTSEGDFDWTQITNVTLTDINNEEAYPSGTAARALVWTLAFEMPIYLSIPMAVKDDLVRRVLIRIGTESTIPLREVDENGELVPFGDPIITVDIDTRESPPRSPNVDQYHMPPHPGPLEPPGPLQVQP